MLRLPDLICRNSDMVKNPGAATDGWDGGDDEFGGGGGKAVSTSG